MTGPLINPIGQWLPNVIIVVALSAMFTEGFRKHLLGGIGAAIAVYLIGGMLFTSSACQANPNSLKCEIDRQIDEDTDRASHL